MEQAPRHRTCVIAADALGIAEAVRTLEQGDCVALPTETVYGLAADATRADAVARIYEAKTRPVFNPLICHVDDMEMAQRLAVVSPLARQLAARFWPGPLTLVLPRAPACPVATLATAGLDSIALRCPDHPVMRQVIAALARPLAAPSANASGRISPTRASHVLASLDGRIPLIVDGGPTSAGLESTIVAVETQGARLLRSGPVSAEAIGAAIGSPLLAPAAGAAISAPGQLASHYAPRQPVRLDALSAQGDEVLIGFGPVAGRFTLSAVGDLAQAATCLFDVLHQAEASGAARIAVAPIPMTGLGVAINDRLSRAAAPRGNP